MIRLFTSESVTVGHPDKLADRISDGILDYCLKMDGESRVACETMIPNNELVIVSGEITTKCHVDAEHIVRDIIRETGYTNKEYGLDYNKLRVMNLIKKQSLDISQGVDAGLNKEQGAGDQGHMFGYAVDETEELMPLPITIAHNLVKRLQEVRENKEIKYLRPDGKSQVTFEHDEDGRLNGIYSVTIAAQHDPFIDHETIKEDIIKEVILPVTENYLRSDTKFNVNETGRFVIGGPQGDVGLTGRKIIVDSYGGGSPLYGGRHGGGGFSGKDPSKVDRSAAYMARYIAKNIVAAELAYACEVQLSYSIGKAEPDSIGINTFRTGNGVSDAELIKRVREVFPLKPADITNHFNLKKPHGWKYSDTAAYGHFGRKEFPWEKTDKAEKLI